MAKLIIYNQSSYFYYISVSIYNIFKTYFSDDKIILVNCNSNHIISNDNLYLTFIPFNKTNMNIKPSKYIVYNFEQFTTDNCWSNAYIDFLKKALFVIDYSIKNVFKLHEKGINAFFLPFRSDNSTKFKNLDNTKKDIDILFIGTLNNKRKEWLKKLNYKKYNIKIITNLFFEKSIEYFARSKIILNIHYYGGDSILEVTRIIPALENKCIILSEESHDEYYNLEFNNIIKITNSNSINDDIDYILNNYNQVIETTQNNFNKLFNKDNSDNLLELIIFIKNIIN
jgi:hypothetical protein